VGQITFLKFNRIELMARTTSLNPITNAPNVGFKKPSAATGIATILYANAQKRFL